MNVEDKILILIFISILISIFIFILILIFIFILILILIFLFLLIYLLTAIGLTPGGSSTVHIYTQTIHRTTQLTILFGRLSGIQTRSGQTKINDELTLMGRVRAVPRLCELYPGICLTTEEKARKNLSQGNQRVPVGTMKTEYTEQSIHNNKDT